MKTLRVGWLLAAALVLQACAGGGAPRESAGSEADELIKGVMTQEQLTCPRHTTMFCSGSGRVNMECSCANP
jgi:PBP1b-binding outer membrane lipoprotein LpoB